MKNKTFAYLTMLMGLFIWTVPALSNNIIAVSDGQGDPGDEITLTIGLNSTEPISALQLTADLGKGAEAVVGSAKSSGRAAKHNASCGTKDGITSFLLFSTSMAEISAGDGIIGEFKIKLGDSPIKISPALSVKATNADGEQISCSASGMGITINGATAEYPEGNVYDFGSVPLRQSYSKTIPIKNIGTSPLEIISAEFSSDDFTSQTQFPLSVPGGMTSNITLGYSPSKRGNVSETVKIISNSSHPDNTLRLLASPYAINEITVENASGKSDTEIEIPISMKNMDLVTGFTLEFQLPTHLKYVDGSFRLSDRKTDHQLTASFKDGKLSATAYSLSDTPFSGEEGILAYFKVVPEGRTSVSLSPSKAVLAASVDGEIMNVTSATYPGRISVSYPQLSTTSSVSMGRTSLRETSELTLTIYNYGSATLTIDKLVCDNPNFEFDATFPVDVQPNQYFYLKVSDSSKTAYNFKSLVQLYSNDPDQRLTTITISGERYAPNSLGLTATPVLSNAGNVNIELTLDNYDGISGLQFDMQIPEGFEPEELEALDRAKGFNTNFSKIGTNLIRYLCYSLTGNFIAPGSGAIFSLPFNFKDDIEAGSYKFTLSNIKLSDTAGVNCSSDISNPSAYLQIGKYIPVTSIAIVNSPEYMEAPGGEIVLAATLEPAEASIKDIDWKSSNDAVAMVDRSGKVVAKGLGVAEITATAVGGENIKATVNIPVKGKEFRLTYYVDDKEYQSQTIRYGELINPIAEPAKEGYTFSGWGNVPSTMPAEDVEIYGSFSINSYTFTFYVDGEELEKRKFEFGSVPTAPEIAEREGYTFSGWTDLPEIVPAHDVDVHGVFNINSYNLIFYIDEEIYSQSVVPFGSTIVVPEIAEKEGYTFSGWGDVPSTMPAHDVEIKGSYNVNSYTVTFYLDDQEFEKRSFNFGETVSTPEAPLKEGYTFAGWENVPETMPAQNVDIYGYYTINKYKLTFYIDESIYSQSMVDYGSGIVLPEVPEKEGYTFSGWGDVPSTMPAHDVEIKGVYNVNQYSISFYVDGSFLEKREFNYGAKVTAPEVEEREDYAFSGWIDLPETMPARNLEIHGKYISTVERFTLSFYVDGVFHSSQELKFGAKVIPPMMEERSGYIFTWDNLPETMPGVPLRVDGYYISKDQKFNLNYYVDGDLYESYQLGFTESTILPSDPAKEGYTFSGWSEIPKTMPHYDVDIYGSFSINSYRISFYVDGQLLESKTLEYGSVVTAPSVAPREGYTFSGWDNLPQRMPAGNVDVNGKFTVNKYKLTFYIDDEIIEFGEVDFGSVVVAPTVTPREGYTFSGWDNLPRTMPARDVEVRGSFSINSYRISFYVDGQLLESKTLEYGSVVTAPSVAPREGYTFSGWDNLPQRMPAGNVDVNGKFTVNKYKLTFYIDDEIIESGDVDFGSAVVAPTVTPREGYTFSGWDNLPRTMPARDVDVRGSFSINSYRISFYVDGQLIESKTLEYGSAVTAPSVAPREGYTFSGWDNLPQRMPADNVDVNGRFTVNTYKLSFYIDDELLETKTLAYGSDINAPTPAEKEGYTFVGWNGLPKTMPAKDLTVTGSYKVNSYKLSFYIDGKLYESRTMNYGSVINPPAVDSREGYTFSGWTGLPATMPAKDVDVTGSFSINTYKVSFYLDEKLIDVKNFEFGVSIVAPIVEEKVGYTFSGWQNMPETMPAKDIEVRGYYIINKYALNFYIDGVLFETRNVEYNSEIKAPEVPDKEGHTFNGWDNLPERMPARDLHIHGNYSKNRYLVTIYLDGEYYDSFYVEYGSEIKLPEPELDEMTIFNGWISEIPETMPARDVEIHGTTSKVEAGVESILDDENLKIDVFTPLGICLFKNISVKDFIKNSSPGVYVLRNGNSAYRIKR